jgi:hypothetical protein
MINIKMGLDIALRARSASLTMHLIVHIKKNEPNMRIITWEQANQIHGWFVQNVQNGVDDFKKYMVKRKQLKQLLEVCEYSLRDKSKAIELLPSYQGFFFGTYDYGEEYYDQIRDTAEKLRHILEITEGKFCSFVYKGVW